MVTQAKTELAHTGRVPADDESDRPRAARVVPSSMRFVWATVIVSCWFVGGLFLDAWAHIHLPDLETFFTPWHGVMYSGFLALVAFIAATMGRNHAEGYPWSGALPTGYGTTPLGIVLFAAGGVCDMLWHEAFGVEANLEAAVSPTHLLLFSGMALLMIGPIRSLWTTATRWIDHVPGLVALAFVITLFGVVTGYANPITRVLASEDANQDLGLIGMAWYGLVLVGPILLLMRREALPLGGVTLLLGVHTALQGAIDDALLFLPGAVLAGIIVDLIRYAVEPSGRRVWAQYLVAFITPVAYSGLYFLTLELTRGIAWSIHLWAGSMALVGLVSLWLCYLIVEACPSLRPTASSDS